MSEVRTTVLIPDLGTRARTPRAFYDALKVAGAQLYPFEDMGPSQPLYDWLEHDLRWLLLAPWEIRYEPHLNRVVLIQPPTHWQPLLTDDEIVGDYQAMIDAALAEDTSDD
jgi:hypothetical protein